MTIGNELTPDPKTLLQLAGAGLTPAKISDACLVIIDLQNEYRQGPIAVPSADAAIANAEQLLCAARSSGAPIIHAAHNGRAGCIFAREAERGRIVAPLTPDPGEALVEKGFPNAFAGTDLASKIAATGRRNLVLAGFMTPMCVSSTARAALDLGYRVTIDGTACGARDLPDGRGGIAAASIVHEVALVELSDRFAIVARSTEELL